MPAIDTSELKKRPPSDEKVFFLLFLCNKCYHLVVCCNGELNIEIETSFAIQSSKLM